MVDTDSIPILWYTNIRDYNAASWLSVWLQINYFVAYFPFHYIYLCYSLASFKGFMVYTSVVPIIGLSDRQSVTADYWEIL